MKKLLSALVALFLGIGLHGADAANDLLLTQRNSGNTGNVQRNLTATTNTLLGWNGTTIQNIAAGTGITIGAGVISASSGSGTVTSVSVVTANGVSGSVATATTTPAITLTLGNITPSLVTRTGTSTNNSVWGVVSDATTYNMLTFNNVASLAGLLGISGGGGSDTVLYSRVPTTGTFDFMVNNALAARISSTGITTGGTLTVGSGGSTAGTAYFGQGTAQSLGTTSVALMAPASVTSYIALLPGTVGTNGAFWTQTTSGTTATVANSKVVPTGTVLGTTDTQTLTNKRVTARVGTTTSSATPTINTDNVDIYVLTAQAEDITNFSTNLSGTPVDGDQLEIRVTGTAARAITWGTTGTHMVAGPAALPTTTVTTKTLYVYFEYDAVVTNWICMFSGSLP